MIIEKILNAYKVVLEIIILAYNLFVLNKNHNIVTI